MRFLKSYSPLKNYLERWTLFKVHRLHVRLHEIKSDDATPFLHSHPFSYISIILRGKYTETLETKELSHKRFSIICRSSKTFHRIINVDPNTVTLFIAISTKNNTWELKKANIDIEGWETYKHGLYVRNINGKTIYSKFDEFWFRGSDNEETAIMEIRPSIDQTTKPKCCHLYL